MHDDAMDLFDGEPYGAALAEEASWGPSRAFAKALAEANAELK